MTYPSSSSEARDKGLPWQMEVYFPCYPALDLQQLAQFVNDCEPGLPQSCEVSGIEDSQNEQGLRVGGFVASLGSMNIGTLVHSRPTPSMELIRQSVMADKFKQEILAHGAWALLTLVGGAKLAPIARTIFQYKLATALCLQGATGVGNPHTGHVFPAGVLRELFAEQKKDADITLWQTLRQCGEPAEMLIRIGRVEVHGRLFLATTGLGYCGLPDLAWKYTTPADADVVVQMFRNTFTYMMEHGPVIKAGHTIGYDAKVAFRFADPPPDFELPYPVESVLIVRKEKS
jgi:hypothetical protein